MYKSCLFFVLAVVGGPVAFAQAGASALGVAARSDVGPRSGIAVQPGFPSPSGLAAVRAAMTSDGYLKHRVGLTAGRTSMAFIMDRIDNDGSFKRTSRAPVPEDLTDTICRMVSVFVDRDSGSFYQEPAVKDKIYKALHYWLDHYPAFKWTTSAMAQPSALGWVLLTLYDDFQSDKSGAYGRIIADMQRRSQEFMRYSWSNGKSTATFTNPSLGDNPSLDWQRMGNLGYRLPGYTAIIAADDDGASMDTLSLLVSNQFSFRINGPGAPAVAALYDGSLQQHGPQIFNMGYGADWLNDMGSYANWVKGSRWKLTDAQQSFWAAILLNGMQWMTWKGYTAHNIIGRHTSMKGSLRRSIIGLTDKFLAASDMLLPEYPAIVKLRSELDNGANLPDSSKYFWDSHVMLVHSPRYFASIRMLSDRVVGVESSDPGSGQGINDFHMGDGSTMIYRTGTEYDDARAGWNWRCIPGTTVRQKTGPLPLVPWSHGYESDNTIAGGVSDGHVSIGLFDFSRTNPYDRTKACKAYFAFPDLLLCMGNSIRDSEPGDEPVYTTINQAERRSVIYYSINGGSIESISRSAATDSSFTITSPSWFWQDGMGYIILPGDSTPTNVLLLAGNRTGNWHDLDKRNPSEAVTTDVFQLSIDHGSPGKGWKDRTYRYAIVPSVNKNELVRFFRDKILHKDAGSLYINRNDDRVVSASYDGYTGIVFTGAGSAAGPVVSSDKPAVVLLQKTPDGMNIHVSDMTSSFDRGNIVHLTINRAFRPASFTPLHAEGPWRLEEVDGGKTVLTVDLSKVDPVYIGEPVHIAAIANE